MGQQPSKDQLLYRYPCSGYVDKIKAIRAQRSKLEVMHPYFPFNTRASVVPASRPSPAEDDCSGNVDKINAHAQGAELEVIHPYFPFNTRASVVPASRPSPAEDLELAMAINASIQSAMESRPPYVDANPISGASTSSSCQSGRVRDHNEIQEAGPRGNPIQLLRNHNETPSSSLPSSPPIENAVVDGCASSLCLICLVAPVEGACIPCGHMVGCMSCLNEIKGKKWSCPVCRTKITQVIRIYTL